MSRKLIHNLKELEEKVWQESRYFHAKGHDEAHTVLKDLEDELSSLVAFAEKEHRDNLDDELSTLLDHLNNKGEAIPAG